MNLRELTSALERTQPQPSLLNRRALRQIIREDSGMEHMGIEVPHRQCYVRWHDDEPEVLLPRPSRAELRRTPDELVLQRCWRALFHCAVHIDLERRLHSGELTVGDIRRRIHMVGQAPFDEARWVLDHEGCALPPKSDPHMWVELTAVYLELKIFAPDQLADWFPQIDPAVAARTLESQIDVHELLQRTRPTGSTGPVAASITPAAPLHQHRAPRNQERRLARAANKAKTGNHVRALIISVRAGADDVADQHLRGLCDRLELALPSDAATWHARLQPLVGPAARAARTNEARLLYDLQSCCVDHERQVWTIDLFGWARSLGRVPVRRSLPALRSVRICRHLARATHRGGSTRAAPELHEHLATCSDQVQHSLRHDMRPSLMQMFDAMDLRPTHLPGQVAAGKLIDEILDRVIDRGTLDIGRLRDALSRNDVKIPDLSGPIELLRGDPVLRADRHMAMALDGVYRPAEIYMRGLQRFTSVAFGTRIGRFFCLYLALPFGGAFVTLEGLQHTVGLAVEYLTHVHPTLLTWWSVTGLGLFLFGAMHIPWFRSACAAVLRGVWTALRFVCWDIWVAALRIPLVAKIARGLRKFILAVPGVGLVVEEIGLRLSRGLRGLRDHLLPRLVRATMAFFRAMTDGVERILYAVDEWMRFRRGESPVWIASKTVLGLGWSAITYFVRLAVNLLIEPQINPIKHFPVVTVSHKLMLPVIPMAADALNRSTGMGVGLAGTLGAGLVWCTPGVFGFIAWELKENWRLYQANRQKMLRAVAIGHHGETMTRLLRPGFHSGTLPKLFKRLRRARAQGRTLRAAGLVEQRHHIEHAVTHFIERSLLATLSHSPQWTGRLSIGATSSGSNRLRVELLCEASTAVLTFEEQSGHLIAGFVVPGWVADLEGPRRYAFRHALLGMYALAGVDLVREQIIASLGGSRRFDIDERGLVYWPDDTYETEIVQPIEQHRLSDSPTWADWVRVWTDTPGDPLMPGVTLLPEA
ncbi:MAG: hypothetical protein ACI9MC_002462 [Kiritimatiellia bacterium]